MLNLKFLFSSLQLSWITAVFLAVISVLTSTGAHATEDEIYLNLTRKEVCSNRAQKCWPVAIGSDRYPTPDNPGPHYVLTLRKSGFDWINPLTGAYYKAGTHNLGNIWIGFTYNDRGWAIGFHETPYPNIPLSQQQSHGCIRMNRQDILELSTYVNYLDKIYVIREQTPTLY